MTTIQHLFMSDTLTALILAICCQYQASNVWKSSTFIERSEIFSSKINQCFRVTVLCSDAKQTSRWVGTEVSKEHTASNSTVPPKHQHPPNILHGTVTHDTEQQTLTPT